MVGVGVLGQCHGLPCWQVTLSAVGAGASKKRVLVSPLVSRPFSHRN
jgi:hypothetical protein